MTLRWRVFSLLFAALAPTRAVWAQGQPDSLWAGGSRLRDLLDRIERAEMQGLDSGAVAWDTIADSSFSLRLWQEPGPRNPLGRIRFSIPNRFGVALHDTRDPQLFGALARAFSHGCVRVADAERLAIYVLRDIPGWTPDWIRAAAKGPAEWRVAVSDSLPTYLVHWTAWVDRDGTVQFRPDLYGWDAELAEAVERVRAGRR